ncbi:hypothetical protein Goklo_026655 [Gossypium klotzschianum]|uniref:DUF4283 domain-containing protein n=1 Tax=Gossypium klotzschianum TaxID=34286 RepID=A0A7J8TVH1_9ROSI|nr:hypothetical protein [Gossypium klotzschianum]
MKYWKETSKKPLSMDMDNTVILKLLGHNIGFSVLQNIIYSLWKPSLPFHLMGAENGYFLAKFENKIDCEKVFLEGLPSYIYKRKILVEIWGLVRKVAKLDMNTDNRVRALTETETIAGFEPRDNDEYLDNRNKKGKEILPGGNQGIANPYCNCSCLDNRAQNRGPLNELGFKNLVGPSRLSHNVNGSGAGLVWSKKQADGSKTMHNRADKCLGESNSMLGFKPDQRNGSTNGLAVSTGPLLQVRGLEELGKEKSAIVTSGNGEISRVTNGGSSNLGLGTSNDDGHNISRFFPRSSQ